MYTDRSQGHSSRCLVKAEEKSFKCKQSAAGDNTLHCMLGFSRWNTASKPYRIHDSHPHQALCYSCPLLSAVLRGWKVGKPQTKCCSYPLSEEVVWTTLMFASNEHSVMFRTMTNGDLWDFLRSFCCSSSRSRARVIPETLREYRVLYDIKFNMC